MIAKVFKENERLKIICDQGIFKVRSSEIQEIDAEEGDCVEVEMIGRSVNLIRKYGDCKGNNP